MKIGVIILNMQKSISAILKLVWNFGLHVLILEIYDCLPRENLRQARLHVSEEKETLLRKSYYTRLTGYADLLKLYWVHVEP
jgi:hypothetical protein